MAKSQYGQNVQLNAVDWKKTSEGKEVFKEDKEMQEKVENVLGLYIVSDDKTEFAGAVSFNKDKSIEAQLIGIPAAFNCTRKN